ncbi:MAG: cold shock domain-containing protein [Candidatus Promineofilum sp.]|nr:cold shock domain-containing protein [Promineifilum sp.]
MNFRDRWEENENGERFVFTVEMQRRLSQAGLPIDPSALAELPAAAPRAPRESRDSRDSQYGGQQSAPAPREREREPEREREYERRAEIVGPETIQIDPQTGKYIGRVKWYNEKKGYGFIVRGAGEEIFFHKSATVGDAESYDEGQWVLYDVETRSKGPEATDIEPYTGEPIE